MNLQKKKKKKKKNRTKKFICPARVLSFLVVQVQSHRRVFSLNIVRLEMSLELNLHAHSFPFPHPEISVQSWRQCLSLLNYFMCSHNFNSVTAFIVKSFIQCIVCFLPSKVYRRSFSSPSTRCSLDSSSSSDTNGMHNVSVFG